MKSKYQMNDYQGALDVLADRELDILEKKAAKDLQELVDNSEFITDVLCSESRYIKALDKACDILAQFDKQLNDEYGGGFMSKEEWKEWSLKDE